MKGWLKYLVAGLCIVAVVGATIGIVAGVRAKNKDEDKSDALAQYYSIQYFEETQKTTQPGVLRAWAVGEKQFTKISYQIDTNAEITVTDATYDVADDKWDKYDEEYEDMNYIDTGVITINLSTLKAGKHIIQVFVYAGSDARECIAEKIFTIQ